ncbi:MAG: F0F1 ATP synthase subunit B [Alphaproteobacteria bacterium]|nr:F0F1 ATP synthase subunit B [Alphaproteobacteria bacterium]
MDAENREIIDATQDAVLGAVDSVVSVIENTAHELGGHHEPFYLSAEFWVAMSFVFVVLFLAYPIAKKAKKMLRKRASAIGKRIEDAAVLKEDAQKLLAEYERKYRKAKQEAQEILSRAEKEVALLRKESLARLDSSMASKEREAKARIKSAQDAALKDVLDVTVDKTVATVKKLMAQKMDAKMQDKLIEQSIKRFADSGL